MNTHKTILIQLFSLVTSVPHLAACPVNLSLLTSLMADSPNSTISTSHIQFNPNHRLFTLNLSPTQKKNNSSPIEKMSIKSISLVVTLCLLFALANSADDSLMAKCSAVFTKVAACLPYATGKAATPTRDCCGVVTELRDSDPACLCFIIEQVHNGSDAVKSMGIQEPRLLQLASACNVANASVSECPRLLHLAPNSPDAAIINNASRSAATTPVTPSGTTSSPSTASEAFWRRPQFGGSIVVSLVVFFFALPPIFL